MTCSDRRPLDNTPTSQIIRRHHNNRLGAVYSSLQGFWEARHRAVTAGGAGGAGGVRRDAYTFILFNHGVTTALSHDFSSTPAQLLNTVLGYHASGGTNFTDAITTAQRSLEANWSTERYRTVENCASIRSLRENISAPIIILLSDGECHIADETMQDLCRRSIALGYAPLEALIKTSLMQVSSRKPVSFHAVAFGPSTGQLRRMAQIASDVESRAPPDPVHPHAHVPSSYHEALDTVCSLNQADRTA